MHAARPEKLDEALSLLGEGDWAILSGGTDFYPALGDGQPNGSLLDISAISTLSGIEREKGYWRIGALATWSDLINTDLPSGFDGLKLAAREVGSQQIQNRATIAGNLCNASPAADGVPPLLTLDAHVEIASAEGVRKLALDEFILGNRRTALAANEMVTAILVPEKATSGKSGFLKLGARKYLVISIVMTAARVARDENGVVTDAAIAVGACSPVAQRLTTLEEKLIGRASGFDLGSLVQPEDLSGFAPIDDVRATGPYRIAASLEMVKRVVRQVAGEYPS